MAKWTISKIAWRIGRIFLLSYLGIFAFTAGCQSYFIYRPMRRLEASPADIYLDYEQVQLKSDGGIRLSGWFIPSKVGRGVILFCQGNAGNSSHRLATIQVFNSMGLEVLIFDYRGYGMSEGSPSEAGTYADSEAAWRYLTEDLGIAPERIIIFGRSLGGAIAAKLATAHQPAGLIVEAAFTSIPDLVRDIYPYLLLRPILWFEYETIESIAQVGCPVLVAHSTEDDMIPFDHGRKLYEAAAQPKQFIELRGGHSNGFYYSGQVYKAALESFLDQCGLERITYSCSEMSVGEDEAGQEGEADDATASSMQPNAAR